MKPTPARIDKQIGANSATILTTTGDTRDLIGQAGAPDSIF
ncbi:MAG: hypothetical protein WHS83_01910 [Chloroflexus sp.]|nr:MULTISPECIES: hypothetical protein [Chloroflexus]